MICSEHYCWLIWQSHGYWRIDRNGRDINSDTLHADKLKRNLICLPAPQEALFLSTWLIHLDTVSRYRIDELRSSDGIMPCLLTYDSHMCSTCLSLWLDSSSRIKFCGQLIYVCNVINWLKKSAFRYHNFSMRKTWYLWWCLWTSKNRSKSPEMSVGTRLQRLTWVIEPGFWKRSYHLW